MDAAADPKLPPVALSVVAPCYNEEDNLGELYRRISAVCKDVVGDDYEIVLVNDGSDDGTWRNIVAFAHEDAHIVGLNLARNFGHQLALSAGLDSCRGERILIIDADLQDPPELLSDMMKMMDEGADVVYGHRQGREGESWFKTASSKLFYRFLGLLTDIRIPMDVGDFRLINRRTLDIILSMPESNRFIRGMFSWIGLNQTPIHYQRQSRYAGETKYPIRNMVRFATDAITSFSVLPLRLAGLIGMIVGMLGLLMLIFTLYSWFVGDVIQGWASVMSAVLIIGSAQLFVIGIFGEYLGRMFIEVKQRPLFIIERKIPETPLQVSSQHSITEKAPASKP